MKEILEIKERLRDVNIVSYSGGKDSTTVLLFVLEAMKGTNKQLYIVTSDTLMEIPFYQDYLNRNKKKIQEYLKEYGINARIITVLPDIKKTFWVCTLGKGYPSSHHSFKWCTRQLKVEPINEITRRLADGNDYTVFVGLRQAESERRARTYKVKDFRVNHYAPILFWSNQDVWTFLLTEPCPWGDHSELVRVYKYASDECVYGAQQNVCIGNARYGCWICPLQKNTQLKLIAHSTKDRRYFLLKDYKDKFQSMAFNWAYRSRIRRDGNPGVGPFLVSVRRDLWQELKKLEYSTGWQLIHPEEEKIIFDYWEKEKDIHNIANDERPILFPVGVSEK